MNEFLVAVVVIGTLLTYMLESWLHGRRHSYFTWHADDDPPGMNATDRVIGGCIHRVAGALLLAVLLMAAVWLLRSEP